jgi:serine/threonine protein phosphatase PrpC
MTPLPPGVGVAADRGLRSYMEDRWAVRETPHGLLAAVFDGHGGVLVAQRAAAMLPRELARALRAGRDGAAALEQAFGEVAQATADADCGSTATAFWLSEASLVTAHVGDSRVVRVGRASADSLTRDHRIDAPDERARVLAMGALLEPPYVVRGSHGLMMTRSLGDRWFRAVGVISEPEIGRHAIAADDVAVLAATDGVWDVLGLDDAASVVRTASTAESAARALVHAALEAGASDNVTAIVVRPADLERRRSAARRG